MGARLSVAAAAALCLAYFVVRRKVLRTRTLVPSEWDYALTNKALSATRLPCGVVDMDVLDRNVDRLADFARRSGKTIRLATKSVRVPDLVHHILERGRGTVAGLMCYSAAEARYYACESVPLQDDVLVAYPVAEPDLPDVWWAARTGRRVTYVIDCADHVTMLESYLTQHRRSFEPRVRVCLDVDCSLRVPGGIHVGVRRSSIHTVDEVLAVAERVKRSDHLVLVGVMGYEAQIAGLGDASPFAGVAFSLVVRWLQRRSREDVRARRSEIATALRMRGFTLEFVNGGGSGNLADCATDPAVTEVAAGSGFLQSHLFDYYAANVNEPALAVALRVTRIPAQGIVTCQGGGYVASGSVGDDKAPRVFLPEGVSPLGAEGFGEVQTPFQVPGGLGIGDTVLIRPAKSGEIAERFDSYALKRGGAVFGFAKTYRGLGLTLH